jgi:hypothetical protein
MTQPVENQKTVERQQREVELNKEVQSQAEFLAFLDEAVSHISLDSVTGKLNYETQERVLPHDQQETATEYSNLRAEFQAQNQRTADEIRTLPGVLETQVVAGAVVVICDSFHGTVELPVMDVTASNERGRHFPTSKQFLGLVMVDINPAKRSDSVPPQTTLIHELHHHNRAVSDYLLGIRSNVKMITAVREVENTELFGRGQAEIPTRGFIKRDSIMKDADQYEAVLGREVTLSEVDNIELQLLYLDELHSSFLQKKNTWFVAEATIYSGLAKGKHWEVVGNNVEDQESTKELFSLLQAVYVIDQYVMPAVNQLAQQQKASGQENGSYVVSMSDQWPKLFYTIGALVGTARSVRQCLDLTSQEWRQFRSQFAEFFQKNGQSLAGIRTQWQNSGIALEKLSTYL